MGAKELRWGMRPAPEPAMALLAKDFMTHQFPPLLFKQQHFRLPGLLLIN